MVAIVTTFAVLRWRLLRGAIRRGGTEQVGAVLSTIGSLVVGVGVGSAIAISLRSATETSDLAVVTCALALLSVLGFSIVAGVAQPIDPRIIAAEPLTDGQRSLGLLVGSAVGPPGLAAGLLGVGLLAATVSDLATAATGVFAVSAWLASLLLLSRTVTNLLALLSTRFPRSGQLVVGLAGLVFYGMFQFVPAVLTGLDDGQRSRIAGVLEWTPPGQIGRALTAPDLAGAIGHLLLGSLWIPALALAFSWTTAQLMVVGPQHGGSTVDSETGLIRQLARRACGGGSEGVIAWRSIVTRFRTPRTALETFTGAGVGLAAVLVPVALRDGVGSGAVLVGGAVQLAVLFMAGNSFGVDGPSIAHEMLAGAGPRTLVVGKLRSILIIAAPLAVVGPLLAASITGEWRFLIAGFGVGAGALLAGSGAALVQSALVPIAIPESQNPFAGGESGRGIVAALLLGVVLAGLAVATVPVALALLWATDRGNVTLVTVFGALTVLVGWGAMRLGVYLATRRLTGRDPEFVHSVTPSH